MFSFRAFDALSSRDFFSNGLNIFPNYPRILALSKYALEIVDRLKLQRCLNISGCLFA